MLGKGDNMRDLIKEGKDAHNTFKKMVLNETVPGATLGMTKGGKRSAFFPTIQAFKKAVLEFMPPGTKIKAKKTSFSGFGYGASYGITLESPNGIRWGSGVMFNPTQDVYDMAIAWGEFLEELGVDNQIRIGNPGDSDDQYITVTGMTDHAGIDNIKRKLNRFSR